MTRNKTDLEWTVFMSILDVLFFTDNKYSGQSAERKKLACNWLLRHYILIWKTLNRMKLEGEGSGEKKKVLLQ